VCFSSKNPSEHEFFVPARTDLGVELITGSHWTPPSGRALAPMIASIGHAEVGCLCYFSSSARQKRARVDPTPSTLLVTPELTICA
jgi:hypothetical protein